VVQRRARGARIPDRLRRRGGQRRAVVGRWAGDAKTLKVDQGNLLLLGGRAPNQAHEMANAGPHGHLHDGRRQYVSHPIGGFTAPQNRHTTGWLESICSAGSCGALVQGMGISAPAFCAGPLGTPVLATCPARVPSRRYDGSRTLGGRCQNAESGSREPPIVGRPSAKSGTRDGQRRATWPSPRWT